MIFDASTRGQMFICKSGLLIIKSNEIFAHKPNPKWMRMALFIQKIGSSSKFTILASFAIE
ncbi:MAG: hypothetical protein Crog4KO_26250 [Crocinitomicaceae bacterium]